MPTETSLPNLAPAAGDANHAPEDDQQILREREELRRRFLEIRQRELARLERIIEG